MNTEEKEQVAAKSAVAGWYVAITGLGVWQAFRGKGKKKAAHLATEPASTAAPPDTQAGAPECAAQVSLSAESEHVLAKLPPEARRGGRAPTQPQLQDLQATQGAASLDRLARTSAEESREARSRELHHQPRIEQERPVPPFQQPGRPWSHDSEIVAGVLRYQGLEEPRLDGWSEPRPAKLPVPTYTPAIMAFGIVLFAMGLATTWYVCLIAAIVFAVAAWRWVEELQED